MSKERARRGTLPPAQECYPGEDDVAIARAILMYLALGNLRDANILMDEIKKQVEAKQLEFPKSDLMQFISFLLETMLRDAFPLFNMLRSNREPTFHELLEEIAEKFYGVKRKNPLQGMGMFGEICKMMEIQALATLADPPSHCYCGLEQSTYMYSTM